MQELKLTRKQENLYDDGFGNNFLGHETISTAAKNNKIDTLNIIKINILYIKGNQLKIS